MCNVSILRWFDSDDMFMNISLNFVIETKPKCKRRLLFFCNGEISIKGT